MFASRRFRSPHTTSPHTQFLSNGRYTAALTHTGGGFSTWRGLAVTRRRDDRTSDTGAHYIYLRDPWSGRVWSPTYQPVCQEPDDYETTFDLDKVTFAARDGDFETQLQVTVSPEDDVEVRRLSIINRGDRPREIEVTSYAEIVLARPEDDLAHPAFGKLFIETEFDSQSAGLLFSRRPRGADEPPTWAFHVLGVEGRLGGAVEWETDRARFLGRGRSPANPGGARRPGAVGNDRRGARPDRGAARSGAPGARRVRARDLRHRRRARSRHGARAGAQVSRRPASPRAPSRWRSRTCTSTLQHLGLSDDQAMLFDRLASRVFGADASCISPADLAREHARPVRPLGLRHLRRSADRRSSGSPRATSMPLVRQLLHAQEYWRVKGLRADVVILNEHPAEYLDETQSLLTSARAGAALGRAGTTRRAECSCCAPTACPRRIASCCRRWRASCCAAISASSRRSWIGRRRGCIAGETCRHRPQLRSAASRAAPCRSRRCVMENGIGGFTPDGREYVVVLDGDRETPLPWSNVLANPDFGTMVSASGSAFTWAGNSRENRLTPFANDPIADPTGEAIYLRDEDSGEVWGATPGPLPRRPDGGRWVVRHARRRHALPACDRRARRSSSKSSSRRTIR